MNLFLVCGTSYVHLEMLLRCAGEGSWVREYRKWKRAVGKFYISAYQSADVMLISQEFAP